MAKKKTPKLITAPHKYFSIADGLCLMVGVAPPGKAEPGLLERKWTIINAKGSIVSGQEHAARYFLNGEIGCEEISAEEAEELAARLAGSLKEAVER